MQSYFCRQFEHKLKVLEVKDIIDQGVTFPVRCRLSGDINAIIKYPKNPVGSSVLINEWVGNSIADVIGLTIPGYGCCYLSEEVIEATNYNEEIDNNNAGLCFFSILISNTVPANRHSLLKATNKETERLILFDHLINNEDRHIGNLLYEVSRDRKVYFIDCSHIMVPLNHRLDVPLDLQWNLSDEAILNPHLLTNDNDNLYDLLCETMGYKEEILYLERDRIRKALDFSVLDDIRKTIPVEWENITSGRKTDDLFSIIKERLMRIDEITDMIAQERRKRQWRKY